MHYTDLLSDYLDEELAPAERAAVEAHVARCAECAGVLEDLRRVVRVASLAPREQPAGIDPWPAVAARLAPRRQPWRLSLSLPQLAAAAALLIAVGMGGMWALQHRPAMELTDGAATPDIRDHAVVPVALGDESFDAAIADLEAALEEGRGRLDPETLRVLEANLAAIDAAVAQARAALETDPANAGLTNHLLRTRAMRVGLLRRAVAAAGPTG